MRRGIAALVAMIMTASLAACGGSTGATKNQSDASTAVLTVWADDTRYTQIQELAKDFTASSGIKVNVVQKSESNMDQEFITQVPTGKGPDVTVMAHDKLGSLVSNGVVAPVDLGENKDKFSEAAIAGVTYDGQTYGVPYSVESVALVRNNKLTTATPKTFDEMISAGKSAGVKYPFIVQMGDKGDPYHFYAFQTSFGAPVFKQAKDGSYTNQLALGGQNGQNYANWLRTQGKAGIFNPSITSDIAKEAFLNGQSPYIVTGPWNVTDFRKANMDITILPIPSAGGQPARPFVGVQMFYQSSKTKNPVLVAKFFEFLQTKAAQAKLQKLGGRVPAMKEVAKEVTDPDIKAFAQVAGEGVPMPAIPEMGYVWDYWGTTEVDITNGSQAPQDAWNAMIKNIESKFKK